MTAKTVLCSLAAVWLCASAHGATWYVDVSNTSGTENGESWATAFTTIQPAIDAAYTDGGGEVWVAAGTYDENRPAVPSGALVVKSGVDVYGGFDADEAAFTERNWQANPTIIDGLVARGGQVAQHVVIGEQDATLDGFVIINGTASDIGANALGGGLLVDTAPKPNAIQPLEVANCSFTDNKGAVGGAIYVAPNSVLWVRSCTFSNNESFSYGGGIHCNGGHLTIDKCVFSSNIAASGGGVFSKGSSITTVRNSLFLDNSCLDVGGGIDVDENVSQAAITNCTFWGNAARDGSAVCGNNYSVVTVVNCIAWNNPASLFQITGGAVSVDYSDVEDRVPVDHNIQADPLFFDADADDLRLQGISPCLDTGTLNGAPLDDIRDVERPQYLGVDMGAYEMCVETLASRCGGMYAGTTRKEARGDAAVFAILLTICWIGSRGRKHKI